MQISFANTAQLIVSLFSHIIYIEDIYFFEVNAKYISSSELKI